MSNEKENIPTEHELSTSQQCDLLARHYGVRYFSELDTAVTKQVQRILNRNFTVEEFQLNITREDRRGEHEKKLDRRKIGGVHAGEQIVRPTFFTTIKWKSVPIVEIEFSDTYYIKLLPLVNPKSAL